MVVEFSAQAITFIMYAITLIVGVFVRVPAIALLCGMGGVVMAIFFMATIGFWLGFVMMMLSGCIAVLGALPLFGK